MNSAKVVVHEMPRSGEMALACSEMPIPQYLSNGMLPPGSYLADLDGCSVFLGHDCTIDEAESRFVAAFPESVTRPILWLEFQRLRAISHRGVKCATFYISGAFVTTVTDPKDIFVVLTIPGNELVSLPALDQWLLNKLFNGGGWEFGTQLPLEVCTELSRPYNSENEHFEITQIEYLHNRWKAGSPLPNDIDGGYLEIYDCEGGTQLDEIFSTVTN